MHIGIKIKRQREKLGMSQQELADLVGYKPDKGACSYGDFCSSWCILWCMDILAQ